MAVTRRSRATPESRARSPSCATSRMSLAAAAWAGGLALLFLALLLASVSPSTAHASRASVLGARRPLGRGRIRERVSSTASSMSVRGALCGRTTYGEAPAPQGRSSSFRCSGARRVQQPLLGSAARAGMRRRWSAAVPDERRRPSSCSGGHRRSYGGARRRATGQGTAAVRPAPSPGTSRNWPVPPDPGRRPGARRNERGPPSCSSLERPTR